MKLYRFKFLKEQIKFNQMIKNKLCKFKNNHISKKHKKDQKNKESSI